MLISPNNLPDYAADFAAQRLAGLRAATSVYDLAALLGYQAKTITYLAIKRSPESKYVEFSVSKRSGGVRTIAAPTALLRQLQKNLADLLADCTSAIHAGSPGRKSISHGFRKAHSILTNAQPHTNRRFVFNVDIEGFFDAINFGRVRGFFIKNNKYALDPKVATLIAQIACYKGKLPQGSPCSPIISNLVAEILDVHLVRLAKKHGCTYTRYADDLTFSSNKQAFPVEIAMYEDGDWRPGVELVNILKTSRFALNEKKTRMQMRESRQIVTGLIVNKHLNTPPDYRRAVRAMVHSLLTKGSFHINVWQFANTGPLKAKVVAGTMDQLSGMLSFVDSVDREVEERFKSGNAIKPLRLSRTNLLRNFRYFRDFYQAPRAVVLTEGITDLIYLKAAIRQKAEAVPELIDLSKKDGPKLRVRLLKNSKATGRLLGLSGGSGNLALFAREYLRASKTFVGGGGKCPVVIVADNDESADSLLDAIGEKKINKKFDKTKAMYFAAPNLYLVLIPLLEGEEKCTIEGLFPPSLLGAVHAKAKTVKLTNKGLLTESENSKSWFATNIVAKSPEKIDFDGFHTLLKRIADVVGTHGQSQKIEPLPGVAPQS